MAHTTPRNIDIMPPAPNICNGLTEYLLQNHKEIISTKPFTVRFQLYFVTPAVRGLWFTTTSPTSNPLIFSNAGINLCISPYKFI